MRRSTAYTLDAFDQKILEILQADNTIPHRAIGERVNLSTAAVHRRIARLQKERIIVGNLAVIDPASVGLPITIIVQVEIENERLDLLEAAKRSFAADPAVQQCYYVTGDVDFVLVVTVASMGAYDDFTRRQMFANANVKRFRSLVVMDRIKAGFAIPLDSAASD